MKCAAGVEGGRGVQAWDMCVVSVAPVQASQEQHSRNTTTACRMEMGANELGVLLV